MKPFRKLNFCDIILSELQLLLSFLEVSMLMYIEITPGSCTHVHFMYQMLNCKVGKMKSQKDAGGLFALVTMEKLADVNVCITKLHQTLFRGQRISVMKVC